MTKWLLWGALVLGVIGGILVFGLEPDESSAGPFDLQAVGGVILAAAFLIGAMTAIAVAVKVCEEPGQDDQADCENQKASGLQLDPENLRSITGLVAVVAAITAVATLTVVAINLLGGEKGQESAVAVTTSAFGIVSTLVSAYLGIKATANASNKVNEALIDELHTKGRQNGGKDPPPDLQNGGQQK
jgi:hypothetical protein